MFEEKIISKIGYIEINLPKNGFYELIKNLKATNFNEDYNDILAGQLKNEKKLDTSLFPKSIKDAIGNGCIKYIETFGHNSLSYQKTKKYNLQLIDCWINFQEKGEYNPLHNHSGDLSFVIWLKIPYELKDEFNHPSCVKSNAKIASCFQFGNVQNIYSDRIEDLIFVDKSYEGKAIVFHAKLQHQVYPFFTSNETRISVSGNFKLVFE